MARLDVVQMKSVHVERNMSRLSLIAAINRVTKTTTGWIRELQLDTLGIQRVECKSGRDHVIPHGTDNDLLVGLINAYVQQGMGTERVVRINVAALLTLAGLEPNGNNYQAVEEGLDRLRTASFTVTDSWWDNIHYRFVETKFSIVDGFRRTDQYQQGSRIGQFQASNLLEVRLAPEITNSIRAGYLRVLNPEIYQQLRQSLARTLYRILEEIRTPVGMKPVKQYAVRVSDWSSHLGLQSTTADKIRRTLEPAHSNLLATGYLKAVEYQGRGKDQTLHYTFGESSPAASAISVSLLTTRGVGHERAVRYAMNHTEVQLHEAILTLDRVLALSRKKVSNPAGLLLSILDHPENYPQTDQTESVAHTKKKRVVLTLPESEVNLPIGTSGKERRTMFKQVVHIFKMDGDLLSQVQKRIEDETIDAALVGEIQSRLVRLKMSGATTDEMNQVLRELL